MLESTCLISDIGYTDNQSKIDLLFVKFLDKINQPLICQNILTNYLEYITRLYKSDTNVCMANQ